MNVQEVSAVLAKVQAYDQRNVGEANLAAWTEALTDVNLEDALDAVAHHHKTVASWIMPIHIITRVREVHLQRLRDAGPPDFPSHEDGRELSQSEERNYRALWQEQIRRGATREGATVAVDSILGHKRGELLTKPVAQALEGMFSTTGRRS